MSAYRGFKSGSGSGGGQDIFWQKRDGSTTTIELIPETGANSVFIKKDLTVDNTITITSSKTSKENINNIEKSNDDVLRLQPKQFNYINEELDSDVDEKTLHYGFIAEDVEEVYPNLVLTKNGHKSLNYLEIIPLLLNKVKDLQKEIDDLKTQLSRN